MLFKTTIRLWESSGNQWSPTADKLVSEQKATIRLATIPKVPRPYSQKEKTLQQSEDILRVFHSMGGDSKDLCTIFEPYPGFMGDLPEKSLSANLYNEFPKVWLANSKEIYDFNKFKYFLQIDYGDDKYFVCEYRFEDDLLNLKKVIKMGGGAGGHYFKKTATLAGAISGYFSVQFTRNGFNINCGAGATVGNGTDAIQGFSSWNFYNGSSGNPLNITLMRSDEQVALSDFYTTGFTDPNDEGGNSDEHTGPGDFTDSNDTEGFPELPNISVVNAGLASIFVPTLPQLNALAKFLWSNDFIDTIKKAFSNPMDAIISLSMIHCPIPKAGTASVKIGMVDSGVEMYRAEKQFIDLDFGSRSITQYWGSALDFSPYTKFSIYLPYIGFKDLDVSEIWTGKFDTTGKPVHIKYHIDILSGAVIAFIKIGDNVLYQFQGSCTVQIPLSMQSMMGIYQTIATTGANIGGLIASGGMTAPMAIGAIANTATNVTNMSESVTHSGAIGNAGGFMAKQKPYIIKTRPVQSLPKNYKEFLGYPSNIYGTIGSFSGFASFESVHFKSSRALNAEVEEINSLLREGVIL